jgi:predicted helicase
MTRKGAQFERICQWYLTADPVYAAQLRRVWLWNEWPGRWGIDAGIDLVAEDHDGQLWAIQAKAYDPAFRITKKDVNRFLAEAGRPMFAYRLLIATTNLIDKIAERTIQGQGTASFVNLAALERAEVDWPSSPEALKPAKRIAPKKPRPHQREAIDAVVQGFETADRGQLIMACGTGKTLAALFIKEKVAANRTLVLLPSLSLLKQTLREWTANSTREFEFRAVCSDDTVVDDDAAVSRTSDLGVPVTTSPTEIAGFLRRRSVPRVVFATYQSSPQIAKAFKLGRVPGFDLVVADEAHRCAGPTRSEFATILDPTKIKGARRLFMTATPRYFTGRIVREAKEADYEVASMDDEAKFGTVFHRLPFGEAIERELLTDYQVAVVGVDDATYREWAERGELVILHGSVRKTDARTLAGQIGLAKAMKKYDLHRTITFTHGSSAPAISPGRCRRFSRGCRSGSGRKVRCGPTSPRVRCQPEIERFVCGILRSLTLASGEYSRMPVAWPKVWMCRHWTVWRSSTLDARRSTSSRPLAVPSESPATRPSAPS